MIWAYPAAVTALAAGAAWWLRRRSYRVDDDLVMRTLPAWLLPIVAAVAALLAGPFYLGRPDVVIITYGLALVWGLLLAFIDIDVHRLPDMFTLPAYPVAAGLLAGCSAATGDWAALARAAACAGTGVVVFYLAAAYSPGGEGLGLGDVKLVGVLGALLGWHGWLSAVLGLLAGPVLAGVAAVVLLVSRRAGRKDYLSYGPWLIAGAYLIALLPPIE